jgi:hypothetical protein
VSRRSTNFIQPHADLGQSSHHHCHSTNSSPNNRSCSNMAQSWRHRYGLRYKPGQWPSHLSTMPQRPTNNRSSAPRRISWPAPTHGRPHPYHPTKQARGPHKNCRGNPPPGVTDAEWTTAFKISDDTFYHHSPKATAKVNVQLARIDGRIRDYTIEKMIRAGVLAHGFIDSSP